MWERNARALRSIYRGERTGVFITLGDPAVYSTFMYTRLYIEKTGVAVEVVPGVTSFCAVADTMMMPLVAWDEGAGYRAGPQEQRRGFGGNSEKPR